MPQTPSRSTRPSQCLSLNPSRHSRQAGAGGDSESLLELQILEGLTQDSATARAAAGIDVD